jgi:hypothetical protein
VPKKESNERFSSMITTTWQILWMPRADDGHGLLTRDEDPQPADTTRASRNSPAPRARFS